MVQDDDGRQRQHGTTHCPRCGSGEVDEFRMGVIHYRLGRRGERFERIMPDSEDPIFRRCVDCGFGDNGDAWDAPASRYVREACL